ncbi:MAG: molybdopterin oxidoreductase family protein [Arenimonas sp.]
MPPPANSAILTAPPPVTGEPVIDTQRAVGDSVAQTTCYMCACRCGINVHLRDGAIRYIEGNPDHPVNRGVLCAKGSAGIMQHYSPARLRKPMLRVGERGANEFREIEWEEALSLATQWLGEARAVDPDRLAFFTGRDQSQALTGWWAQQYGTINYAAHGGFCSVNMAAGGLYTLGGSFWEFGEPDWDHAQLLFLWGVAEDHDSNPIKLGLGKLKARGAKIVAINPVRTGYGAIADEWVGIRPGTDGLLAFALIHELLKADRIDLDYLVRYTNAHWLVIRAPGAADDGLFVRDADGREQCFATAPSLARSAGEGWGGVKPQAGEQQESESTPSQPPPSLRERGGVQAGLVAADTIDINPKVVGEVTLPDGRIAVPVFHLLAERYLDPQYSPDAVAERCGIPAVTIRRLARELAAAAFDSKLELPIAWTDTHGRAHASMVGRPVAMHAMRGISAHSNGFHTCRALHVLQLLLGAVDAPGSFRYQPPFPRPVPPANRPGKARGSDGKLDAPPLGFIHGPEDLLVDAQGQPRRIDHAYSWKYPLAVHGMLHTVIRNAWAQDPAPVDVLFMFMANMSWNSAMNTRETLHWLTDKDARGEYRIPKIIYADAYSSEMVAYADLVLPDTTYLERYDAISMLDRPISDADAAADALRLPVFDPATQGENRDVRGFQSVLLDLGARLRLPALVNEDGTAKFRDYADYILRHERAPGVGLLAGWRGADGGSQGKGAPNPQQIERYREHGGFWHAPVPEAGRYYKMANRDYLQWSAAMGFIANAEPVVLQVYSETLQKFRLAALGHGPVQPPDSERERVATYFDPLPIWYEPFESAQTKETSRHDRGGGHRSDSRTAPTPPLPPREGWGEGSVVDAVGEARTSATTARAEPLSVAARHLLPEGEGKGAHPYPLHALTQRPPFMYHAWGSQNAWLRQIATRNFLYIHPDTARAHDLVDGDWAHLDSHHGRITVPVRTVANMQPDTVWTWNAIGKRKGAWKLAPNAPEATQGFLLNPLISDVTPRGDYANADPVTGQAAWFDLRVRIAKTEPVEESQPQLAPLADRGATDAPLEYGARFTKKAKP